MAMTFINRNGMLVNQKGWSFRSILVVAIGYLDLGQRRKRIQMRLRAELFNKHLKQVFLEHQILLAVLERRQRIQKTERETLDDAVLATQEGIQRLELCLLAAA